MNDQPNRKSFPAPVLLTLTSGKMLGPGLDAFHEAAEYVMGHPIWTHEFGDRALWDRMRASVIAGAPELSPEGVALADSVTADNATDVIEEIRRRFPTDISIPRGGQVRDEHPLASLTRLMPHAEPVIVVTGPESAES